MATMPRCDSPQLLQGTSFTRFSPGRPVRSPSPSPPSSLYSEASSTLSDSSILITPESSLLLNRDNVGVYNYVVSKEDFKPSPSLTCESLERLPQLISIALKNEFPARCSHARDSKEVAVGTYHLAEITPRPADIPDFGNTQAPFQKFYWTQLRLPYRPSHVPTTKKNLT